VMDPGKEAFDERCGVDNSEADQVETHSVLCRL
jgi:hypothetical protein